MLCSALAVVRFISARGVSWELQQAFPRPAWVWFSFLFFFWLQNCGFAAALPGFHSRTAFIRPEAFRLIFFVRFFLFLRCAIRGCSLCAFVFETLFFFFFFTWIGAHSPEASVLGLDRQEGARLGGSSHKPHQLEPPPLVVPPNQIIDVSPLLLLHCQVPGKTVLLPTPVSPLPMTRFLVYL